MTIKNKQFKGRKRQIPFKKKYIQSDDIETEVLITYSQLDKKILLNTKNKIEVNKIINKIARQNKEIAEDMIRDGKFLIKDFIKESKSKDLNYKNFIKWCFEKSDKFNLSRIELYILKHRPDVTIRTINMGGNYNHLQNWVINFGFLELGLGFMQPKIKKVIDSNELDHKKITIVSYINSGIGIGNYAKIFLNNLSMYEEVEVIDLPHKKNKNIHKVQKLGPINFFIIGIDQTLNLDLFFSQNEFRKSYNVLIPFWELENFDEKLNSPISQFDEIWAPTTFIYNMFKNRKQKVRKIPLLIDDPKNMLSKTISNNNKSDYFITILDLASGIDRKNVLGTIEAFLKYRAKYKAKHRLIIKVYSSQKSSERIENLIHLNINNLKKKGVVFIQKFLPEKELEMLMKGSIAYVSLHKSEGLGLNVLQAMSLGKKVIVTNYGGITDFCNNTNSYLVDYKLSLNLKQRDNIYVHQSKWATPKINSAVRQFRLASEDYNNMFYEKENNAILTLLNLKNKNYTHFFKIYTACLLRYKISSFIKLASF